MAVGAVRAFRDVDLVRIAAATGCATFTTATIGIVVDRGPGRWAAAAGGSVAIGIGRVIPYRLRKRG